MFNIRDVTVMLLCGLPVGAVAEGLPIEETAARFGAMQTATNMQISPDGKHVFYIDASLADEILYVAEVDTGKTNPVLKANDQLRFAGCDWLNNNRIGCQTYGQADIATALIGYTRYLALDLDGDNLKLLGQRSTSRSVGLNQFSGNVLNLLPDDPEHILMEVDLLRDDMTGTRIGNTETGLSVQRVNVNTARMVTVQKPIPEAVAFFADKNGDVRGYMRIEESPSGRLGEKKELRIRKDGERGWQTVATDSLFAAGELYFEGFSDDGESLYLLAPREGRHVLLRKSITSPEEAEVIFSHEEVDVNGLVRFGRYGRPVGYAWSDEYNHIEFFDEDLATLQSALSDSLGGLEVGLQGQSWDGSRVLLTASADDNPGTYYVFDREKRTLAPLLAMRGHLDGVALGNSRPIRYPARDGTEISAYLTLPPGKTVENAANLPLIVLPHGGPQARDYWGFDWLTQAFAVQGYAVIQPQFRGSAGFGLAWIGENAIRGWRQAISDIDDAALWAIGSGLAEKEKTAIVGWSYGGYAALQSQVVDPDLYKAVVAIAPVVDFQMIKDDARNFTNANIVRAQIGAGDHVDAGSPLKNLQAMVTPVMLFHGDKDVNVGVDHSRKMAKALRNEGRQVEYVEFSNLDHGLRSTAARSEMLLKISRFLQKNLEPESTDAVRTDGMGD